MNTKQTSIGREAAVALSDTEWWVGKSPREIAEFQLTHAELCCPFGVFHEAVEKALDRPVWTHEFGMNFDGLWAELFNDASPPAFEDILNMIPSHKRAVIAV